MFGYLLKYFDDRRPQNVTYQQPTRYTGLIDTTNELKLVLRIGLSRVNRKQSSHKEKVVANSVATAFYVRAKIVVTGRQVRAASPPWARKNGEERNAFLTKILARPITGRYTSRVTRYDTHDQTSHKALLALVRSSTSTNPLNHDSASSTRSRTSCGL